MTSLFVYGTLGPGRPNAHILESIRGHWSKGSVNGHLVASGWGAAMGFPGLTVDPDGPAVRGFVFDSDHLPDHWDRLDAFEGVEYSRVLTQVTLDTGEMVDAYVYVLNPEP